MERQKNGKPFPVLHPMTGELLKVVMMPTCKTCKGFIKFDTRMPSYHRTSDPVDWATLRRLLEGNNLCIVLGLALGEANPHTHTIVGYARAFGSKVISIAQEKSLLDPLMDIVIRGRCSEVLPLLAYQTYIFLLVGNAYRDRYRTSSTQ